MRAFVVPRKNTDAVERAEVPTPRIDDDELLVRVEAVGVGIHDPVFLPPAARFPYPIGIEAAGVVEEVGHLVPTHLVGDRIAFVSAMQPKGGTWAERVAVKADALIVAVPDGMDYVEAAAVPVAGNTALRALHAVAVDIDPIGASLFIAGGSGAIGTLAVQLARARGWRVAASASEANHEYLRSLGAEIAVDYHDPGWPDRIRRWMPEGVDAAVAVQPGTTRASLGVVRDGGRLVTVSGDPLDSERNVHVQVVPHQTDMRAELGRLLAQVAAGEVHVEVERVYPFEDALAALARVRTRHTRGKLVLEVV